MVVLRDGLGTKLVAGRGPPWSGKPMVLRNYPSSAKNPSPRQMQVRIALARAANQNFGAKGLINGMPAICTAVKASLNYPAGLKQQTLAQAEQNRQTRHQAAPASIAAMESKLAAMGMGQLAAMGMGQVSTPAIPMRAGGSFPF